MLQGMENPGLFTLPLVPFLPSSFHCTVALDDLGGLLQPWRFYDSMTVSSAEGEKRPWSPSLGSWQMAAWFIHDELFPHSPVGCCFSKSFARICQNRHFPVRLNMKRNISLRFMHLKLCGLSCTPPKRFFLLKFYSSSTIVPGL